MTHPESPQPPAEKSSAAEPAPREATRGAAALHLIRPGQLQESLEVTRPPSVRNSTLAGLQAALACLIALPAAYLSPWPHLLGYASLGALAALFGRFESPGRRRLVVFQCGLLLTGAVLAMSATATLGASAAVMLLMLAALCGFFFLIVSSWRLGLPGALIFVFAAGASMSPAGSWHEVLARSAATAAVSALAWLICALTDHWRHQISPPAEPARPLRHRLVAAGRIALGCAIAALAAHAAGAHHPAWAAMGALAVMQGTHLHINMNRALQRMAGTVAGACIAWLILAQNPSVWTVIASIVVFQFITEAVIGYNYAFGQITVTPMALLMSYLAAPGASPESMAPERIFDTIVGACVGIALAVACSTLDDRVYYARHRQARRAGRGSTRG